MDNESDSSENSDLEYGNTIYTNLKRNRIMLNKAKN